MAVASSKAPSRGGWQQGKWSACYLQLTIWLLTICYLLLTLHYSLPARYHSLLATRYSLLAIYYLLPVQAMPQSLAGGDLQPQFGDVAREGIRIFESRCRKPGSSRGSWLQLLPYHIGDDCRDDHLQWLMLQAISAGDGALVLLH